jgi:hypothetical protein
MSLATIKFGNLTLQTAMGLKDDSMVYAFVNNEWIKHQATTDWKLVPSQRILYRAIDVEERDCIGIAEELKAQPRKQTSRVNRLHDPPMVINLISPEPIPSSSTTPKPNPPSPSLRDAGPKDSDFVCADKWIVCRQGQNHPNQGWPSYLHVADVWYGMKQARNMRNTWDILSSSKHTIQTAFVKVFQQKFVPSTVKRKEDLLKMNPDVARKFIGYGCSEEGEWGKFESAVLPPPAKRGPKPKRNSATPVFDIPSDSDGDVVIRNIKGSRHSQVNVPIDIDGVESDDEHVTLRGKWLKYPLL